MSSVSTRPLSPSSVPAPVLQPTQASGGTAASAPVTARQAPVKDGFDSTPTARARVDLGGTVSTLATAAAPAAASAGSVFASNDILNRYQPSGASAATASQDRLPAGVAASHRMADADRARLLPYKEEFAIAAQRYGVPPAVLAAIASRESRGGAALDRNGLGDNGNGFGLMQVDKRYHTPAGGPYSQGHINQAASILSDYLGQVRANHPSWPPEQQMRGAITAYNSGVSNVRTIEGMDRGTTGNDYSNDVWARAMRLSNDFGGQVSGPGPVGPNPTPVTWTQAPSMFDVRTVPETFLKQGQEGAAVQQLQKLLGMPASAQDGKFGASTQQAVRAFQQANGLTPPAGKEGWVGKTTLEYLEKAAFPENPSTVYTPAPTLEQLRTVPETFLKQGMEGEAVRQLQGLLGLEGTAATGRFDERTQQAVLDFQKAKGLTPPAGKEGWVGKTTLEFLEKASGPVTPTPDGTTYTPAPSLEQLRTVPETFLKQGQQGDAVKHLQGLLKMPAAEQTGNFDAKTHQAVQAYQQANGLTPPAGKEGWVGKTTLEHLEKAAGPGTPAPGTWTPAPALADVKAGKAVLEQGMEGPAVAELQKLLGFTAEQRDGKFGKMTQEAVHSYQKANGLTPPPGLEGVVGKTTLEHLEKAAVSGVDGISARGRQQMQALLDIAQRNSAGKNPDGRCLWHVNNWLDRTTYGQIGNGQSPRMPLARNYGDWLNNNYQSLGLKKLDIDNPYQAPPGAIIVVRPGTPGTRHPTAGDIVVMGNNGRMFNGGEMNYGGPQNFPRGNRHVIGIFVPQ
ncbi:MAG TPA: peptidoglycan-binding protein [Myxococcaceae bacterium]|nr:peptidoglycan-binding protein [Myxococcaceae bacterium]